ncbi:MULTISPECIES: hypothetical protein [Flavobacterium]|uniref:Host attachment protein n=1 Tax=Flavobacterium keumense TaxID=1306518 RepID=A0ABY8N781_9FLAO|nr:MULTISPECIES: hypothetical protein [Flavobacterium]WGK95038.1 hypothetical protein MG292_02085 [Flavobacterium keumense]
MKRQTGIWIDSSKAIIVSLNGKKESITEIDSTIENKSYPNREGNKGTFSGSHHSASETQLNNRKKEQTNYFMDSIIDYIKRSDELYVFGPASAKTELKKRIQTEKIIAPDKLKGVDTSDKLTINQIVAKVRNFYDQ